MLLRLVLPLPGLIPQAQPAEELPVVPAAAQTESAGPRSYYYNEYEAVTVFGGSAGESADTTAAPAVPAAPAAAFRGV